MLFSHLFLHVSCVLGPSRSHTHKLWLTQKGHAGGLHSNSHPTLPNKNNTKKNVKRQKQNISVLPGVQLILCKASDEVYDTK